jgi:hypothetical protein
MQTTQEIHGTAAPHSAIEVRDSDGETIARTTANQHGAWCIDDVTIGNGARIRAVTTAPDGQVKTSGEIEIEAGTSECIDAYLDSLLSIASGDPLINDDVLPILEATGRTEEQFASDLERLWTLINGEDEV